MRRSIVPYRVITFSLLACSLLALGALKARGETLSPVLVVGSGLGAVETLMSCDDSSDCGGAAHGPAALIGVGLIKPWDHFRLGVRGEGLLVPDDAFGAAGWGMAHVGFTTRYFVLDVGGGVGAIWLGSRASHTAAAFPLHLSAGVRITKKVHLVTRFNLILSNGTMIGGLLGAALEWMPRSRISNRQPQRPHL